MKNTEIERMERALSEELLRIACRLRLTEARQQNLADTAEEAEESVAEGTMTEAEADRVFCAGEKVHDLVSRLEQRRDALKATIESLVATRELAETARSDRKINERRRKGTLGPRTLGEMLRAGL